MFSINKPIMNNEHRKRIVLGITVINLSIFLISACFLTDQGSFSYSTGNDFDYFTSKIFSRIGWDVPLMIVTCSSLCSLGIYMITVKPDKK